MALRVMIQRDRYECVLNLTDDAGHSHTIVLQRPLAWWEKQMMYTLNNDPYDARDWIIWALLRYQAQVDLDEETTQHLLQALSIHFDQAQSEIPEL